MPVDREPPDGDYAAYVDSLVNGRTGSPGAVRKPSGRRARRRPDESDDTVFSDTVSEGAPRATTRDARIGVSPTVIRRDHNSHTEFENVVPDAVPAKPDSLGPRGSPRLTGIVQIGLGLLFLAFFARTAIRMTYSHDPFSLDNIVPLLLLGFIARMFLVRGNAKLREARLGRLQIQSKKSRHKHPAPRA